LESEGLGELFLIDNASTDGSMALVEKYRDPRLRIIRLKKNIGLTGARNLAAAKALYPYIAFADADSIVEPKWLGFPCFLLDSDKEIGSVQCHYVARKRNALTPKDKIAYPASRLLVDCCVWKNGFEGRSVCYWHWLFPIGAGLVVRRDAWDCVKGFDPTFFVGNDDVDFGIRLWLSGYKVAMSSEGTVYHEGGQLRSRRETSHIFKFYGPRNYLALWIKNMEIQTIVRQMLPLLLLYPLMAFWRGGIPGVKGFISFLRSFDAIISNRIEVQSLRTTSDKEILHLMRGVGIMPIQQLTHDFQRLLGYLARVVRYGQKSRIAETDHLTI